MNSKTAAFFNASKIIIMLIFSKIKNTTIDAQIIQIFTWGPEVEPIRKELHAEQSKFLCGSQSVPLKSYSREPQEKI